MKTEKIGVHTLQQHIHARNSVDDKVRETKVVDLNKDSNSIKIQGREKVLRLRKNDKTFTPGNGFKPNVQHY